MDITLQTKVNNINRSQFYQQVYRQQFDAKQSLVNLDMFANDCILVDCCGWHYRDLFPTKTITCLETIKSALQFKLDRSKFDKLIDNQKDSYIGWPKLSCVDPVLIFDRSPMLKYQTVNNLIRLLSDAVEKYNASQLVVNLDTLFIDDNRLQDRFCSLAAIAIPNFTVREVLYKIDSSKLSMKFKRNHVE
jgi:hypothetical protein